ncbi:hypothetical protein Bbelb_447240, partial [Branchiostoma belcheri]
MADQVESLPGFAPLPTDSNSAAPLRPVVHNNVTVSSCHITLDSVPWEGQQCQGPRMFGNASDCQDSGISPEIGPRTEKVSALLQNDAVESRKILSGELLWNPPIHSEDRETHSGQSAESTPAPGKFGNFWKWHLRIHPGGSACVSLDGEERQHESSSPRRAADQEIKGACGKGVSGGLSAICVELWLFSSAKCGISSQSLPRARGLSGVQRSRQISLPTDLRNQKLVDASPELKQACTEETRGRGARLIGPTERTRVKGLFYKVREQSTGVACVNGKDSRGREAGVVIDKWQAWKWVVTFELDCSSDSLPVSPREGEMALLSGGSQWREGRGSCESDKRMVDVKRGESAVK